jgi:hypothetical protein
MTPANMPISQSFSIFPALITVFHNIEPGTAIEHNQFARLSIHGYCCANIHPKLV